MCDGQPPLDFLVVIDLPEQCLYRSAAYGKAGFPAYGSYPTAQKVGPVLDLEFFKVGCINRLLLLCLRCLHLGGVGIFDVLVLRLCLLCGTVHRNSGRSPT